MGPPGSFLPNRFEWNAYILAAYELPWGIQPYIYFEFAHQPSAAGDTNLVPSLGLNILFSPHVQLKTQFVHVMFRGLSADAPAASDNDFSGFLSRLVLAF